MDLFGDLPTPAAKKSSSDNGKSDDLFGGLPATALSAASDKTKQQIGKENADAKTSSTTVARPGISLADSSDKRKSAASLVSTVGKAGTLLAFVPQAISQARKKKKISSQHQPQKTALDMNEKEEAESTAAVMRTITAGNHTTAQPEPKLENERTETNNIEQTCDEPYVENEPESIRLLHESVSPANAYNPHFPNDYLAHLERKKTERIQKELQQSALQRLDQQEKLRKKIEEERRKIESSGDVNKIVEMRSGLGGGNGNGMEGAGRGRGRGRGTQNLPAWLVRKQQEEQQKAVEETSSSIAPITQGQFDDVEDDNAADENCAITLFDVVAPGEIDEQLESEITEECEEQSLKVVDIKIFDASSTCQFVRADITFADGAAARQAVRLFNGRKFGDRQITAKIME
eukprot:scaffold7852_cov151-Skeletonema_menzelii.AAC.18